MRSLVLSCVLLGAGPAAVSAVAQTPPASDEAPPAQPAFLDTSSVPSIEAVGLVRSPVPARSTAILRSQGRTRVVAVGETAFGARLLTIGTDTVELDLDGRSVELRLLPAPVSAPPPPQPRPFSRNAPPEDPTTPARDMERRQVQIRLAEEMNRILSDTALAPVTEDGRVVGLQVKRIAEASLLTDAGLRAGDVLTSLNGTTIDGMASLVALWPRLQNATALDAVVLRGGQPFSLRVTLR